ncbi:MAG: histidine--tRNA ligase [Mariprofundaceae bacterium]|nr:histidine--tRNA ligase [Mariprofundaceae bacterium]
MTKKITVKKIQSIRGIHDGLPETVCQWQQVESAARTVFSRYAFNEVRLPILEPTHLFVRSIGEQTDIVAKEMYHFVDQGHDHICLRPEGTAGAVRAYLQAGLTRSGLQRWFYVGAMFRRERPQKGRLRQFQQIGAEFFGAAGPLADAEVLAMAWQLVHRLGLQHLTLEINSLGCPACRPGYREKLVLFLRQQTANLCPTCIQRIDSNPMRVLDCKVPQCQQYLQDAPEVISHLCDDCNSHWQGLQAGLTALSIPYCINPRIVRGLDYYNRTAFEIVTDQLGAQGTVLAGGRYDGLVESLGGPATPAIGFAAGVERLALLLPETMAEKAKVTMVAMGNEAVILASMRHADTLRQAGIATIHAGGGTMKRQMKIADREQTPFCLIIGEDECATGQVMCKNMRNGSQQQQTITQAMNTILQDG